MATDHDLILGLSKLARLTLSESEVEAFGRQIPKILHYVDQLASVDTTGVMSDQTAPVRPRLDLVEPFDSSAKILDRAPERVDRFWKVPPVK